VLRGLYSCVLRLHPLHFRRRFGDEMLSIFDHASRKWAKFVLLNDGFLSLIRQWGFREESWDALSDERQLSPDAVPSFYTLAPFHPRTPAVVHGLLMSLGLFCITCFGIRYSWIHVLHVHISPLQAYDSVGSHGFGGSTGSSDSRQRARFETPLPMRTAARPTVIAIESNRPKPNREKQELVLESARESLISADPSKSNFESQATSPSFEPYLIEIALQDYVGTYAVRSGSKLNIVVSAEGGDLMMKVGEKPKLLLTPLSESNFMVSGTDDSVEFVIDERSTKGNEIQQLRLRQAGQVFIAARQF